MSRKKSEEGAYFIILNFSKIDIVSKYFIIYTLIKYSTYYMYNILYKNIHI